MPGTVTSVAGVTSISPHGLWLLLEDEELLLPFEHFPWFRKAMVEQIMQVEGPTVDHLYCPLLDIDLSVHRFGIHPPFRWSRAAAVADQARRRPIR